MKMNRDNNGVWICTVNGETFRIDKRFSREQVFTLLFNYSLNS